MLASVLTPFSATAFLASRTIPPLVRRSRGNLLLPAACDLVLLCLVAFAFLHASLLQVFVVMTVAGYGVGALYAATPGFIVRSAPRSSAICSARALPTSAETSLPSPNRKESQ
ncbi:MAG TPA: hypothetical protein VHT26_17465 [Trebonia sp.]|nr:hypothetical protein [Trebonia sp.]